MMMLFVMATAVCIAALRYSSPLVVSLTFTATLTILLFSLLAAVFDRHKTFWIGFAIFGWGYAILSCGPGARNDIRPYLFTTHLLDALHLQMNGPPASNEPADFDLLTALTKLDVVNRKSDESECFQRIGHSLLALLHGVVGGILAVFLAARARKASEREDDRSPPNSKTPTS
jgi:hypothetical protein